MKTLNPIDFIKKYKEVTNHHAFILNIHSSNAITLLIEPTLVNPLTNEKSKDESENTKLVYWTEVLLPRLIDWEQDNAEMIHGDKETSNGYVLCLDSDLSFTADTYEDAVLKIHKAMTDKYGQTSEELISQTEKKIYDNYSSSIDELFSDLE